MIQRIQSVYLALVALLFVALFFNSVATVQANNQEFIFSIFGLHLKDVKALELSIYPTFLLGLTLSIIGITAYAITLFKTRIKQMMIVRFISLLILLFLVMMFMGLNKSYELIVLETKSNSTETMKTTYLFGCILPFVALILNVLAFRGVKKDEELVRSADRLR